MLHSHIIICNPIPTYLYVFVYSRSNLHVPLIVSVLLYTLGTSSSFPASSSFLLPKLRNFQFPLVTQLQKCTQNVRQMYKKYCKTLHKQLPMKHEIFSKLINFYNSANNEKTLDKLLQ